MVDAPHRNSAPHAMGRTSLRLAFMGSPAFAVPILDALSEAGYEVVRVYTQPPRPAGRGQRKTRSAVHVRALQEGIRVRTPARLSGAAEEDAFAGLEADAAVVAAYGLILPRPVLDAPRLGCLNVHASLLPRWRGAAPIQRAILAGDETIGVTIIRMDESIDTGPMLLAEELPLDAGATTADLQERLAALGARLIVKALDGLAAGTLVPVAQPREGASVAPRLGREEGRIDWRRGAADLERAVRALNPWPGTWFEHRGARVKVLAAEVARELPSGAQTAAPGTVLDDRLLVRCGGEAGEPSAFRPTRLQRPGKAPLDLDRFLLGYPLTPGNKLA